jgi:UDP-N-acetylmuramate: L-alanyl-gamma-D-glutamyl-meso-diaminopimelate ligase
VMADADEAAVFYSRHALEIKRMPELPKTAVEKGFDKKGLQVFNDRTDLEQWLHGLDYKNAIVVFMSSGNYDGVNTEAFARATAETVD